MPGNSGLYFSPQRAEHPVAIVVHCRQENWQRTPIHLDLMKEVGDREFTRLQTERRLDAGMDGQTDG